MGLFKRIASMFGLTASKPECADYPVAREAERLKPPVTGRSGPAAFYPGLADDQEAVVPRSTQTTSQPPMRADIKQSVPNRMTPNPTARSTRRVNIGLDFGTSSTKVMVRIEQPSGQPRFLVVGPSESQSTVLFPSTVALVKDELRFGEAAESVTSDIKVRSFKMNLPAEAGSTQHNWRGKLVFGGTGLSAEDVSTLYLAWVLREVLEQVCSLFRGDDLKVTVNAAAPLKQMQQDVGLRTLFHRVTYYALKLHKLADDPWHLDVARKALAEVKRQPLPTEEASPVSVFPETHAAMTSYMLLPGAVRGKYASVDVGAGSTDVAFFWFHRPDGIYADGAPEMCYYGADSDFVGMDDFDRKIADQLAVSDAKAKMMRESGKINLSGVVGIDEVCRHVYACYRSAFGSSYDRCTGEFEWRYRHPNETGPHYREDGHARYTLCLVGGGSLSDEVRDTFCRKFPLQNITSLDVKVLRVPDNLEVLRADGSTSKISRMAPREQPLLLLAHGLAHRAVDIPLFKSASATKRVRQLVEKPTHEELYAK